MRDEVLIDKLIRHTTQEQTTMGLYLAPLKPFLDDASVTDICINQPGVVFVESARGWERHAVPALTFAWCYATAQVLANWCNDEITETMPLLSGQLPGGERVRVVIPPCVPAGTVSITIRRPPSTTMTFEQLVAGGTFARTRGVQSLRLAPEERATIEATLDERVRAQLARFRANDWAGFLAHAVRERSNIIASGITGGGKTTLANALAAFIPLHERLVTVEDTREARLPHENVVSMVYADGGRGLSKATAENICKGVLRQRPDRVLLSELRDGDEAFLFFYGVVSRGHPGTITTIHANSAKMVLPTLSLMIKSGKAGSQIDRADILNMLIGLLDVVIQMHREDDGARVAHEIYYDPAFAASTLG